MVSECKYLSLTRSIQFLDLDNTNSNNRFNQQRDTNVSIYEFLFVCLFVFTEQVQESSDVF